MSRAAPAGELASKDRLSVSQQQPKSRSKPVYLLALIGLLAAGAGIYSVKVASTTRTPAPLAQVRIGYFANLSHAQAVLGVSSGEFAGALAPAKLTTKVFNAGPTLIEALFAGEIDIGYVGPGPALAAHTRSKGDGIRVIAGTAANGVGIVARAGSGIEKVADLKGKRVGTPQHGNTQDIA